MIAIWSAGRAVLELLFVRSLGNICRVPVPCRKVGRLVKRLSLVCSLIGFAVIASPVSAHIEQYRAIMNGANESPPQTTDGMGSALITLDLDLATMRVEASFSDLTGNVTIAHIHCCTTDAGAGNVGFATTAPTFPGFPAGVTSGVYDQTFDMSLSSSYNPSFITANGGTVGSAYNAFITGVQSGKSYFNIHTSFAGGGEIRGFLQFVPEPSSALLLLMGSSAVLLRRRKAK